MRFRQIAFPGLVAASLLMVSGGMPAAAGARPALRPAAGQQATYPHTERHADGKLYPVMGWQWANPNNPNDFTVVPVPAGSPLPGHPHLDGDGAGKFHPAMGWRWIHPNNPNDFTVEPVPAGVGLPGHPHLDGNGAGKFHPAMGWRWIHPNNPNDFTVEPVALGVPLPGHSHLVGDGTGSFRPAPCYSWIHPHQAHDYTVKPKPEGAPAFRLPHVVCTATGSMRPAAGYHWVNPGAANDFRVAVDTPGAAAPVTPDRNSEPQTTPPAPDTTTPPAPAPDSTNPPAVGPDTTERKGGMESIREDANATPPATPPATPAAQTATPAATGGGGGGEGLTYNSAEGGFQVWLPGQPKLLSRTTPAGHLIHFVMANAQGMDYLVGYSDLPNCSVTSSSPAAGDTVTENSDQQGHPAVVTRSVSPGKVTWYKKFCSGNRFFDLALVAPANQEPARMVVNLWFASFQLRN